MPYNLADYLNDPKLHGGARAFDAVRAGDLPSYDDVQSIVNLIESIGVDIESESDRIANLVPYDRVSAVASEEEQSASLGYEDEDEDNQRFTGNDKFKHASEMLLGMRGVHDVDPLAWLVALPVTDGDCELILGYAIFGQSFSGMDVRMIGYELTKGDLIRWLSSEFLVGGEYYDAQNDTLLKARWLES
jgi:hypothetical protein